MLKVRKLGGGLWGVKDYDKDGTFVSVMPESFKSESEAEVFLAGLSVEAGNEPGATNKSEAEETTKNKNKTKIFLAGLSVEAGNEPGATNKSEAEETTKSESEAEVFLFSNARVLC